MAVFGIDGMVAEIISEALHIWCRRHRRARGVWLDPHPRVFGVEGMVAEKPNGIWLILSAADIPPEVISSAAKQLHARLKHKEPGLARRSILGALASSHARLEEEKVTV